MPRAEVLHATVDAWNQCVQEGGHSAMVMVEGISGGYALERVIPVVVASQGGETTSPETEEARAGD